MKSQTVDNSMFSNLVSESHCNLYSLPEPIISDTLLFKRSLPFSVTKIVSLLSSILFFPGKEGENGCGWISSQEVCPWEDE